MNWVIIGSGNGLSPVRRQAITWTNADLLPIGLLGTYFSDIWIGILSFSFKKMQLKMSSDKIAVILSRGRWVKGPGGCFTNVSRALQNNLAKIHSTGNHIYGENFKLKLWTCAQSHALGTRTKFQLEILIRTTISAIHKFQENILESSRNVSETNASYVGYTHLNDNGDTDGGYTGWLWAVILYHLFQYEYGSRVPNPVTRR